MRPIFFVFSIALIATSCGKPDPASKLSVLSGMDTNTRPEVVKISNLVTGGFCTGTFVNDTTLLTASHCLTLASQGGAVALYDDQSVKAIAEFYNTASQKAGCTDKPYPLALIDICPDVDLAVIVFPRGTAGGLGIDRFPAITPASAAAHSLVSMFGYGPKRPGGPDGTKNFSMGIISDSYGNHLTMDVHNFASVDQGADAGILPGDSGGPVFDQEGRIVGINSGYQSWSSGQFRSYITDIRGANSKVVFDFAFAYSDDEFRPLPISGW